ncbi:hypothetical protein EAT1b_0911 [Exiguobacterium sp. AT1b]|uniref:DUF3021 domain-containing protein n=1 Tax=Exiguobacterium sp. (strain ATCC BAA-1283 / AT1b) TaxID=360911 RepID=C4L5M5_EXISA|nr:DUF3021 family protein [Exiguobacterium sp. AT1b]ACQ69840.1 hypothetical protein EAT1b_0911 [Exiguobacterium sp. AT1b]
MQLLKKGIMRSLIWSLPFAILALYQSWSGNTDAVHAMLVYVGVAFFLGLTSVIYEIRQWSFKKQIFIHWSVMHVTILPLLWFGGATPVTSIQDAMRLYLNFTVSGLILFTVSYFIIRIRRQVKAS